MAFKSYPLALALSCTALKPFVKGTVNPQDIPAGPVIAAANHSSFADGVVLGSEFGYHTRRPMHMVTIAGPFRHWLWGWVLRSGRNIPLDRTVDGGSAQMMAMAKGYLAMGEGVGIFPEGHVNNGITMRRPRPGAVLLGLETGVPLLPVGIRNSYRVLPMGSKRPRFGRVIELHIGTPIDMTAPSAAYRDAAPEERRRLVNNQMGKLIPAIAALAKQKEPLIRRSRPTPAG